MSSSASPDTSFRLLVTGATGFIGCRLAAYARRQGIDVVATGRAQTELELQRAAELQKANVPVVAGLLQDATLLRSLLRDRTAVIHLAAAQHEADMPEEYFHAVNVGGTDALLAACVAHGIKRFVYGSSIGVYGESHGTPLDEASPLRPDNMYTRSKVAAEEVVRSYGSRIEASIARIGEAYGPGDLRLLKLFRSVAKGRFFMIGDGSNERQCIHVQDLNRGLLLAAHHPAAVNETFVLAGRRPMTTQEMVASVAAAIGRPVPTRRLPMGPFLAAARVMETVLPPLHISPPLNTRRLDFFRKSLVFSVTKAHERLGFRPEIEFHDGAADTAAWYCRHGYLATHSAPAVRRTESI